MSLNAPAIFELAMDRKKDTPTEARRWLESLPIDLSQDAFLLTHELVVNALVHTATEHMWLTVLVCPNGILVQVANEGAKEPRLAELAPYAESGRGLRWIDALSETWGSGCTDATHVWFQLGRQKAFASAKA